MIEIVHQRDRQGQLFRRRTWGLVCLTIVLLLGAGCTPGSDSSEQSRDFFVFVTADPQLNVPEWGLHGLKTIVGIMNETPGKPWPFGGVVEEPKGVLVPGDLVDDTGNPENWTVYTDFFHPQGDAKLQFPVYEGIGNHDLAEDDQPFSVVERAFIERNSQRPGDLFFGPHRYHYSWDWEGVHFVNLNLYPGDQPRPVYGTPSPWNNPHESLSFLKSDLAQRVGDSGRPVVLMWHYGLREWGLEKWWTEEDLTALESVLEGYNVVLILHGHEHRYERYEWAGYDVVMTPAPYTPKNGDSTEEKSLPKAFLAIRITQDSLQLARQDTVGWQQTWGKSLEVNTPPS